MCLTQEEEEWINLVRTILENIPDKVLVLEIEHYLHLIEENRDNGTMIDEILKCIYIAIAKRESS